MPGNRHTPPKISDDYNASIVPFCRGTLTESGRRAGPNSKDSGTLRAAKGFVWSEGDPEVWLP